MLHETKELNIPRQNCMKTRLDLEKAIVETQHKYNDIIFGNDSKICEACLNKLPKQLVINKKARNQKLMDYKRWSFSPEKHSNGW